MLLLLINLDLQSYVQYYLWTAISLLVLAFFVYKRKKREDRQKDDVKKAVEKALEADRKKREQEENCAK